MLKESGGCSCEDLTNRQRAAQLATAKRRKERMNKAIEELAKAQETKLQSRRKKKSELEEDAKNVRISTTDPECRKMKMGDSSFKPAYNVQVVTGTNSRVIYGVDTSNSADQGKAPSMLAKTLCLLQYIGVKPPSNWLCDSGYSTKGDIEGCHGLLPDCNLVFASKSNRGSDPTKIKETDGPGMKKWRELLKTKEFKETYSQRGQTVELSNARLKSHGLSRFTLIGLLKVKSETLLAAISHNISICTSALSTKKTKQALT